MGLFPWKLKFGFVRKLSHFGDEGWGTFALSTYSRTFYWQSSPDAFGFLPAVFVFPGPKLKPQSGVAVNNIFQFFSSLLLLKRFRGGSRLESGLEPNARRFGASTAVLLGPSRWP